MHRTPFLFLLVMAAAFGSPCGAQPVPRDTDFIVRKIRGDGYHAAFVNHDRSSPSYESLEDFSFADSIGRGNAPDLPTKGRSSYRELSDRWLPLFCWQEQYCLYSDYPYKCLMRGHPRRDFFASLWGTPSQDKP